jgi:hypothetical protein
MDRSVGSLCLLLHAAHLPEESGRNMVVVSTSLVVSYLLDREPSLSGAPSRRGRFFLGTLFLISVIQF